MQMPLHVPVELFTLAEGSAVDLFKAGIEKICADLDDPQAKEDAPRSFSLRFTLQPVGQGTAALKIELLSVKMAPSRAAVAGVVIDRSSGKVVLTEAHQASIEMPDNVTQMEDRNE